MIDLNAARALAHAGAPNDSVTVSRRWLQQVVAQLEKGEAKAKRKLSAPTK